MPKRKIVGKQILIPGEDYVLKYNIPGEDIFPMIKIVPEQRGGLSGGTQYRWEVYREGKFMFTALIDVPFYIDEYYFLITTLRAKTSTPNPGERGRIYFIEEVPDPRTELSRYVVNKDGIGRKGNSDDVVNAQRQHILDRE